MIFSGNYRYNTRLKVKIGGKFLAFKTKRVFFFYSVSVMYGLSGNFMYVLMVWTLGIFWFLCFKGLVSDTYIGIPNREREKQQLHLC